MKGAIDLTRSERGVFAIVILICATVLVVTGKLTGEQWCGLVKVLCVALIVGKTFRPSGPPPTDTPLPEARTIPPDTTNL